MSLPHFTADMDRPKSERRKTGGWRRRLVRSGKSSEQFRSVKNGGQETQEIDIPSDDEPSNKKTRFIAADANLIDWGIDHDSVSPRSSVALPRDKTPKAEGWLPNLKKIGVWRDDVEDGDARQPAKIETTQLAVSIPSDDTPKPPKQLLWTLPELRPVSPAFSETNRFSHSSAASSAVHPAFRMIPYSIGDSGSPDSPEKRPPLSTNVSTTISRSSISSLDNSIDDASSHGRRSSMTSVQEEDEEYDVVVCDYVEAKARTASEFSILPSTAVGVLESRHTGEAETAAADIGRSPSPTLSELVMDLESRLETIHEDGPETPQVVEKPDLATPQTPRLPEEHYATPPQSPGALDEHYATPTQAPRQFIEQDATPTQAPRQFIEQDSTPTQAPLLPEELYAILTQPLRLPGEQDATSMRTPGLPRKSRKRDWRNTIAGSKPTPKSQIPADILLRRSSAPVVKADPQAKADLLIKIANDKVEIQPLAPLASPARPPLKDSISLDSAKESLQDFPINKLSLSKASAKASAPPAAAPSTPTEAQAVLLRIMSSFDTIEDLLATSMMNRGMHRVFKANEMYLLKTVVRNHSPALWELREWSPVEFSDLDGCISPELSEHSPFTYMHGFRKDQIILESLKALILERCQPFLRTETVAALALEDDENTQRFNDAFYRIWCFCKIFGCEKGREHDVTGQLDWLRGGILARQEDCAATVDMGLDFDMSGVLLNAPDFFALGNKGGLSASELYDMTELWNCLAALLGIYHGKTAQARKAGIFTNAASSAGTDKAILEEWLAYILTLGPSVVLELARFDEEHLDAGFKCARFNGWTDWMPTASGSSRQGFLRQPVARLYEQHLVADAAAAAAAVAANSGASPVQKEASSVLSAKKVAKVAAEIKIARSSSGAGAQLARHDSRMPLPFQKKGDVGEIGHFGSWAGRSGAVDSAIEGNMKTSNRLTLLSLDGVAENTVEVAIAKIVRLGFSDAQAKEALKVTDMGSGLRVDRAVDLLLSQHGREVMAR